jgi:hypothetical protein
MAALIAVALVSAASLGAWAGLGWVIVSLPPNQPFALAAAYGLAFVGITLTGTLAAWLALRPRLQSGRLATPLGYVWHSMLLAVITLFALWLQSLRMLTPTVTLLLVGLYAFLELAILFGTRGSVELPLER